MDKLQCVSAFYDIGREKWDSYPRSLLKYVNDFFAFYSNVCVDLVLFCEPKFGQYLQKRIEQYKLNNNFLSNIKIIEYDFSKLYFFKNIQNIRNVQAKQKMLEMYSKTKSPEYSKPEYVALMWSKIELVNEAIKFGLVNTEKIAWIDFGIAHGVQDYINKAKDGSLSNVYISEKSVFFKRQSIELSEDIEYYLSLQDNVITPGGFYIINTKDSEILLDKFRDICNDILALDICDDDQTILSILSKKNPNLIYNQDSTMLKGNPIEGDWFPIFFNLERR